MGIFRSMNIGKGILRIVFIGTAICFLGATFATTAAAATRTWTGNGADNNWMTAANWDNPANGAPAAGDDLLFPVGVAKVVTNNNSPAGTTFNTLTFDAGYTVNGNRIVIASIEQLSPNETTINCELTPQGGMLALGLTLHVAQANGALRINGVISTPAGPVQPGLRKTGAGLVRLLGANTYTGVTAIEEGEVRIHHVSALGAITGNTVVSDGGVLGVDVNGSPVIAEPLMLAGQGTAAATDGALTFWRSATMSGTVALFGAATPRIVVAFSASSTISGVISGSTGFIKSGEAPLNLTGANIYTGTTTVAGHELGIGHAQALGSPSWGTTVLQGGFVEVKVPDVVNEPLSVQTHSGLAAVHCLIPVVCTWGAPIVLMGGDSRFFANGGSTLRLAGDISGIGGLDLATGQGDYELLGSNTYAGNTMVRNNLTLAGHQAIPDTSYVQFFSDATLLLNGFSETVGSFTGGPQAKIQLGAATLTMDTADPWPEFSGVISGSGGIVKKGVGTFELFNAQAYTGLTSVEAGVFILQSSAVLPGPVTVKGGVFRGAGSVGALTASDGRIEPGLSPGVLTTQVLNLDAGSTLALELNGPTAGTQHDQVVVTGTVVLNGATLELSAQSADAFNVPLVIVKNDGAGAVTGTFAGLAEGAIVFPANGRAVRITYAGGDGNDIVLVPTAPTYYLSEGATGAFFDLDILIANPTNTSTEATLTFLLPDGSTIVETILAPGHARRTVKVDTIQGLESTAVSTIVTSKAGLPLVVERTMRWNESGYGAHTEKAVTSTSKNWYFAEGAQGFFATYLLLANPQSSPNVATVRFLREHSTAIVRTYPVAANSRYTVDAGADPDLVGSSFGMHVTFEQPGVAERSMYFGDDPFWKAGHESAGVTEPSSTWFLAEGATGPFFETFVLLANPGDQPSEATVTFLPDTGVPVEKKMTIPAQGRLTLNIEAEDPSLANAAVATQVSATQPILVERAQYWPDQAPQWFEAHNSFGVTAVGTKWGLAEGRNGGLEAYQTYILLANPGTTDANVTVSFLLETGSVINKSFQVKARSRFNVDTGIVSELTDTSFGATITSDQPIAVERAMYNNANGQVWAAGTNATATPLP